MNSLSYATLDRRFGAYLIDALASLLLVLAFVFIVVRPIMVAVLIPGNEPPGSLDPRAVWQTADVSKKALVLLLFFLSAWIPPGVYYAALESSSRQSTLGKRALGLLTLRSDGSRVSFHRAFVRFSVKAVAGFIVPFGFVALLPVFGARRQGLHDWLTGVVVVVRHPTTAEASMPAGMGAA